MENNLLIKQNQVRNILLGIIVIVLISILFILKENINSNRFSFNVDSNAKEIYIFDEETGTLFITTPQLSGDYEDEIWVKLNPTFKGKTMPFREILQDNAKVKLRNEFLKKKEQAEKQNSKQD